ncbi:MAG: helix-turn-helix domain-containing protein [Gammaproteobacteria bacterium]|nr:helix-turn-helix domain-containing protein [Gammaproteobacteria bacterium]
MKSGYSIGQMAEAGDCKVQTIRYYEQKGLLPEPRRTQGNQRIYSQAHYQRLRFIRHGRELGFSLDRIRQILDLSDDSDKPCATVDMIARQHLREVESKIRRLQCLKQELKRMISECAGDRVSECRIIEVLADHELCLSVDH